MKRIVFKVVGAGIFGGIGLVVPVHAEEMSPAAQGNRAYNLDLTGRRAATVARFLVQNIAIDPERLVAADFGEPLLKVPDAPLAAINRRVEVGSSCRLRMAEDSWRQRQNAGHQVFVNM